jgi:demethylmacrocin O-methyltransferase
MEGIKNYFKQKLSASSKIKIKRFLQSFEAEFHKSNLDKLAIIFKSDKFGEHFYTPIYKQHFSEHRRKKIKLLEIGVGGYRDELNGGNSLRMWKKYFEKAQIFSFDIYDKKALEESRIKIFKGSQNDTNFLKYLADTIGDFDIIIDDGSHINQDVITTFNFLFPKLNLGGIYVIEDVQTSYWPECGGNSKEFNSHKTIVGYFKSLIDGLNHEELIIDNYESSYFDQNIKSIHFYHNLIIVNKGLNNEGSNYLVNNKRPI